MTPRDIARKTGVTVGGVGSVTCFKATVKLSRGPCIVWGTVLYGTGIYYFPVHTIMNTEITGALVLDK